MDILAVLATSHWDDRSWRRSRVWLADL